MLDARHPGKGSVQGGIDLIRLANVRHDREDATIRIQFGSLLQRIGPATEDVNLAATLGEHQRDAPADPRARPQ
jgi:hypothetical protein